MAKRRCPNCGEQVPSNSLTCPKCFAEVPRDTVCEVTDDYRGGNERETGQKNPSIVRFLSTVPAFLGILGLGQIYLEPKRSRGYWFLAIGVVLYATLIAIIKSVFDSGILSAVFLLIAMVIVLLIYISAAVAVFLDAAFGSVFKVLRF